MLFFEKGAILARPPLAKIADKLSASDGDVEQHAPRECAGEHDGVSPEHCHPPHPALPPAAHRPDCSAYNCRSPGHRTSGRCRICCVLDDRRRRKCRL